MADNYITGATGSVLVNGTPYAFGKWKVESKTAAIKVVNFTTAGFRKNKPGITEGTFTCECPVYNQGNMPLQTGNTYTFTFGYAVGINIPLLCYVEKIDQGSDAENAATVTVTGYVEGTFTPSIT